jgi:hypothetical protein
MVDRTSTGTAPWTLVEANDKGYARVKILRTLCQRIEAELEGKPVPKAKPEKPAKDEKGKKESDGDRKVRPPPRVKTVAAATPVRPPKPLAPPAKPPRPAATPARAKAPASRAVKAGKGKPAA